MIDLPDATPAETSPGRHLTPGAALAKLFLVNADRGANDENDELVKALRLRAREIQALAEPRRAYPVTTVTGTTDIDPCPYCGTSDSIQQTSGTGRTRAWACNRGNTEWQSH